MEGQGERLAAVENAVKEINDKFDSLLAAMAGPGRAPQRTTRLPASGRQQAHVATPASAVHTPFHWAAAAMHTPAGIPPPPPSFLQPASLQGPAYDDYVLVQLRKEEFYAQRVDDSKGFVNDIYTKVLDPKPYMYLNRPGVNTLKKTTRGQGVYDL